MTPDELRALWDKALPHTAAVLKGAEVTVKELHTFTDADMDVIADALRIASAHYAELAELTRRSGTAPSDWRQSFEAQSRDAADLQLKIEAGR